MPSGGTRPFICTTLSAPARGLFVRRRLATTVTEEGAASPLRTRRFAVIGVNLWSSIFLTDCDSNPSCGVQRYWMDAAAVRRTTAPRRTAFYDPSCPFAQQANPRRRMEDPHKAVGSYKA